MPDRSCTVDGCDRPHVARGYCTLHWRRWKKHGDALHVTSKPERPTCSECDRPAVARGYCHKHWSRWARNGHTQTLGRERGTPPRECAIAGCGRPGVGGHGWCEMHYRRFQRHGHPLTTSRIVGDDESRFASYLVAGPAPEHAPELGECWLWTGAVTPDGYATMAVGDLPTNSGHRWSYRHHVGPLPDGLELDHLCRVRRCVNPWHLDPVPHAVNVARANAVKAAS